MPPEGAALRATAIALVALLVVIAGVLLPARFGETARSPLFVISEDLPVVNDLPRYAYDGWQAPPDPTPHAIVGKRAALPRSRDLVVRGWAFDPRVAVDAAEVLAVVDDRYEHVASGFPRPDVVSALGNPAAEHAGFEAHIDTSTLASGEHRFAIEVVSRFTGVVHAAPEALQFSVR